jgi:hypothetical protein
LAMGLQVGPALWLETSRARAPCAAPPGPCYWPWSGVCPRVPWTWAVAVIIRLRRDSASPSSITFIS